MFTVCAIMSVFVAVNITVGLLDLIRDIYVDNAVVATIVHNKPNNMTAAQQFFLGDYDPRLDDEILDSMEVCTDAGKLLMTFGFTPSQLDRILNSVAQIDESSEEPIFVDLRSSIHDEIRREYRSQSYEYRNGLSQDAQYAIV